MLRSNSVDERNTPVGSAVRGGFVKIEELWVYPIKSCRGFSVESAKLDPWGLENDRRWMIVDEQGVFITQRKVPTLSLLEPQIKDDALQLSFPGLEPIVIPLSVSERELEARVWKDTVPCVSLSSEVNKWLSQAIGMSCQLVQMRTPAARLREKEIHPRPFPVSFADSGPVLLTNRKSLRDLENTFEREIQMMRFRPNLVVESLSPFEEEGWKTLQTKSVFFETLYPCERCQMITVDQLNARKDSSVFKNLAAYRKENLEDKRIVFGMRMIPQGEGQLAVGDLLEAIS